MDEFLPFWQTRTNEQRAEYLERWPPPNEDWLEYMTLHWCK
jgi:hypothetical protein